MEKTICELFAGVGGFRLGFERLNSGWKTVWFSQWEPGAKNQWAHDCYVSHFGESFDMAKELHTGDDISIVNKNNIPDHTLLVGGFPCQDYSVAKTLSSSKGIKGKKGVLWWQIRDTIIAKEPPFCLFENVDRLLKSPANQRGRDFGVILACLNQLGYIVEWRVVNAATYGAAQRRRRTFIFACKRNTFYASRLNDDAKEIFLRDGMLARAFPVEEIYNERQTNLPTEILDVSENFSFAFQQCGFMRDGTIYTCSAIEEEIVPITLGEILENHVDSKYYIEEEQMAKWEFLKGAKKIQRQSADGHEYVFSEGAIGFPDLLDKPGRTMLTSEATLNRSSHVVANLEDGKLRVLTPIEAERLQGFDDNWTNTGMPERMRYFCMGNALVVPMITRMGAVIDQIIDNENESQLIGRTNYTTKEAVLRRAQEAIGLPLSEIDKTGRLSTGKGAIGTVLEQSWFGYKPNNISEPDFIEAGVELKVTPYIVNSTGIRAKERLVCNIINYMTECNKTFETSDFWHKCKDILIMSYEYKQNVPKTAYTIDKAILFSFPSEDLIIIKQDWEKIISKIRAGEAHLITEGDTLYLAACTKGANSNSLRQQPFSPILAKQRAYSLKSSYMTRVLNSYIFGNEHDEHIIKDWHELLNCSFEDYLINKVSPYYGKTQSQLKDIFAVKSSTKNLNEVLLAKMLGIKGKIAYTEEFQNANIIPKTIRIQKNGHVKESMSFPTFKFTEIVKENWEDSTLRNYLEPTKFFFVVFKENDNGEYVFKNVKFWNIPAPDLEEVKSVWTRTVEIISKGVNLESDGRVIHNNLPKQSESNVAHVRPHASNANDTYPLPDGRSMSKQCFWFNSEYIEKIIAEEIK